MKAMGKVLEISVQGLVWRIFCLRNSITLLSKHAAHAEEREVPLLEEFGEEEVLHDDCDEAGDEGFSAGSTDAAGAGAAGETFVAADQTDASAEKGGFEDAFKDLPVVHAERGVL